MPPLPSLQLALLGTNTFNNSIQELYTLPSTARNGRTNHPTRNRGFVKILQRNRTHSTRTTHGQSNLTQHTQRPHHTTPSTILSPRQPSGQPSRTSNTNIQSTYHLHTEHLPCRIPQTSMGQTPRFRGNNYKPTAAI